MQKEQMQKQTLTGYPSIDKPWLKYYSQEAIDMQLTECTMYEYIFNQNQDNLDRIAIDYYETKMSYRQMFQEISYLAGTLESIGIKEGDIVTVCMLNSPQTICLVFALNKIGAVANMVCGANSCEELKKIITDTKSSIVFTLDLFQNKFEQIVDETPMKQIVVAGFSKAIGSSGSKMESEEITFSKASKFILWEQFFQCKRDSQKTSSNADAAAVITYTGGTTGGAKGAVLSNMGIVVNAQQHVIGEWNLQRNHIWIQVLPLYIAYGMTFSLMVPLIVGMTIIVRNPMEDSISELCQKFKPNHIAYGPAYWEAFADDNKNIDLSCLISPVTGGDILNVEVEKKINKYLEKQGCRSLLVNGYGMTEANVGISVNYQQVHKLGSVGIPFVKNIVSAFNLETGKELKYGEQGEICVQTPSMMKGYINNQEETNNVIRQHDDGKLWLHSGDLGYITEDGFVYISGRLKRYMLHIANGLHKKVFSLDIEKVLMNHPKVAKCTVVPMRDEVTFQVPAAYIILKKEYHVDGDLEKELISYAETNLQDGYRPRKYIFVDKFPLTKVGKIDYLALERDVEERDE